MGYKLLGKTTVFLFGNDMVAKNVRSIPLTIQPYEGHYGHDGLMTNSYDKIKT